MHEQFIGNILRDNKVVLEKVEGVLYIETSKSGWKSWYGSFDLHRGKNVDFEGFYLLKLEDGRSGKFLVEHQQITSSGVNCIEFQGSGPFE